MTVVDMDGRPHPNGKLKSTSAMSFIGRPPGRAFLDMAGVFPMRNVTMVNGDGGTGKSLLITQLAIAVASGTPWLGIEVESGTVLYVSAEDDLAEIWNRFHEICEAEDIDKHSAGAGLEFVILAGEDSVLGSEDKKTTRMMKSPLYQEIDRLMYELGPILLILDNLADVYSGNENSRSLVKQFISMLRHLAIKHDCAVVLLAHPSKSGLADDSGTSGSTAWNNSVRSRIYLHRVTNGDGRTEEDQNARLLEFMKSNYSAKAEPIPLLWKTHRFVRTEKAGLFDGTPSDIVDRVQAIVRGGEYRCNQQSGEWLGYVVADMLDRDVGRGLKAEDKSGTQQQEISKVARMIATWERNKVIRRIQGKDSARKTRDFYAPPASE